MNVRRANVAYRYMWTAWLNLLRWVALLVMLILLGVAVANRDPGWLIPASVAAGVFVLSLVMFLLESPAVRCLGCGGTLLRAMRCTKHKTAKRVFGSYTLHSTLALASYAHSIHCPYCGMRYKIARSTRKAQHEADTEAHAARLAETKAKEEKMRRESEAKNVPYY